MSRPAIAFRPALLTGSDADYDAQNRNNRDLARAIERLQLPGAVIAATPDTPSRKFISEQTGAGPWTWTGLDGDAAGLRGYEIVYRVTKAAGAAHRLAMQFNGDTGANYTDATAAALTWVLVSPGMFGNVESTEGVIRVPFQRSGAYRNVFGQTQGADASPQSYPYTPGGVWLSTAAITSISVINSAGTVDAGTFALFALMDTP